jgi:hypothetical protein
MLGRKLAFPWRRASDAREASSSSRRECEVALPIALAFDTIQWQSPHFTN